MEYIKYNKQEYKKIDITNMENYKGLESYLKSCSEAYINFLDNYFVREGGILTNELRFTDVGG